MAAGAKLQLMNFFINFWKSDWQLRVHILVFELWRINFGLLLLSPEWVSESSLLIRRSSFKLRWNLESLRGSLFFESIDAVNRKQGSWWLESGLVDCGRSNILDIGHVLVVDDTLTSIWSSLDWVHLEDHRTCVSLLSEITTDEHASRSEVGLVESADGAHLLQGWRASEDCAVPLLIVVVGVPIRAVLW